jgi:hypothetical protein
MAGLEPAWFGLLGLSLTAALLPMLVKRAELMSSVEAVVALLVTVHEPPVRTLLQTWSTAPRRVSVPLLTSAMRLLTLPEPGMVSGRMVSGRLRRECHPQVNVFGGYACFCAVGSLATIWRQMTLRPSKKTVGSGSNGSAKYVAALAEG